MSDADINAALSGLRPPMPGKTAFRDRGEEYEGQIVEVLFRHYKTPKPVRDVIWQDMADRTGVGRYTLDAWYRRYPSFPIYLGTAVISHLPKTCTLSKLFLDFGHRPFMQAREALIAAAPQEVVDGTKPCGLIVRWPHLSGPGKAPTGLVIHDRGWSSEVPGTRISWTMQGSKQETLCIEHLSTLLKGIDDESPNRKWEPDEDER